MAFNSFNFWVVFPFIFSFYWLIPAKYNLLRKVFLVLASYLLYMNWKPVFALVLLGVTLVTFLGGYILRRQDDPRKKKIIVWIFGVLGLLPLLTFKYYNFINDSLTTGLSALGLKFSMPGLNWAVPVGISFFTFQAVGYMLDVYHGRVKAEENLLDYVLFVSFFPQVTSGPISTAEELMPQIKAIHVFNYEYGKKGLKQILWGMFIKLVIADRLGLFVDSVYANYIHYSGATCFAASIFYSIQIYCDFAGYSLIAIGIAKLLGFKLIDNFRRPYMAVSITDFWKRWHISLTKWLTRQVYIPLGGSHCNKLRTYLNILITFLVSGIWHGANLTYIVWGCIHGVLQIIEKALHVQMFEGKKCVVRIMRIFVTFLLVNIAWIFFRMPDLASAGVMIGKIFTSFGTPDFSGLDVFARIILVLGIVILVFKDIKDEFFPTMFAFLQKKSIRWINYSFLFIIILALGVLDSGQFLYVIF